MISLVSVVITLIIGLSVVYGQNQSKYMNEDEVKIILGACYLHADRPNPVQDLVDKSLISAEFAGDTCASVKKGSEDAQATLVAQAQNSNYAYEECTQSDLRYECDHIVREYCDNPVTERYIVFGCNP